MGVPARRPSEESRGVCRAVRPDATTEVFFNDQRQLSRRRFTLLRLLASGPRPSACRICLRPASTAKTNLVVRLLPMPQIRPTAT
jgi:hypothetical protein